MIDRKLLIRKFFEENTLVGSNIVSFNDFIENQLQKIVNDQKEAIPAVVPPEVEEVKFEFGAISLNRPTIVEADGSERELYPMEARLRNLTYSSKVFLEVGLIIDGKERERAEVEIAEIPIMLKSKLCHLSDLNSEQLIDAGEDPEDCGGYFIIDGTERVLVYLEDLAPNTVFAKLVDSGPITHKVSLFSAYDTYRIPHSIDRNKEGLFLMSFTTFSKIPFVIIMKALGVTVDKDIVDLVDHEINDDLYINLYEALDIKTAEDAQEFIAKTMHLALPRDRKIQRVVYMLDNLLLPHVGRDIKSRKAKARFIGRMVKKLIMLKAGTINPDDRDHYMNKRVRMSGDLLEDLFRTNFKVLVSDIIYIFTRGVRRGRIIPLASIVRTKLLTQRIKSAMATGKWTSGRQGVSQRLERDCYTNMYAHLRNVVSLLEASRESFEARELHPTHWGRLCPIESPQGKNIGLRKTLAILSHITKNMSKSEQSKSIKTMEEIGLKPFD
ncbi:DNA-directed RNA polymerase subunit B'' [Candidatus Woesearchaeota archaeon]|jgi:DNA-directed RNA polymerase beta subunit|nr:DNA-directed RNA polymerase subunit B'' [Candidatus Woesearchaeota archaeon]MBT4114100.1 DNA-directed RNA polymerase subunit B'' [Candidatus Woesearchaeota archaeon]MBT4248317.1 DNA-directed RNA polymerase subunit B'' [Candidatus Woesearchaeota archaeon]